MNSSNDNNTISPELPVTAVPVISQQQQSNQHHRQVVRLARGLTHHESLENFDFNNSNDLPPATTTTTVAVSQEQHQEQSSLSPKNISDSTTTTRGDGSPVVTTTTTTTITTTSHNNSTTATPVLLDHPSRPHVYDQGKQHHQKNYQVFPGRNKFFCDGRLMTSREYGAFTITVILLVAPCVLFAVFTCPFLWTQVHPAIPIVFAYVFILALVSMIKTSWSDPGIIPRDLDIPTATDDSNILSSSNSTHSDILLPKEIKIKDMSWTLKYCETCRIYRPPRASHCRQCDNCVENEDHHCIWLNNCIGKRNYRSFFVCISASTVLCLYIIGFCLVHMLTMLQQEGSDMTFGYMFGQAPVSFVLAIVCFVLLFMVGGLTLYHCSLIMRGVTTHEQLRAHIMKAKDYPSNPYKSDNPFINITRVLCQPQPKSYLGRRKFVE
ncbi:DHHC palmitoyltransferase-domain-containing protein [Phascolomyces articulosus]|uniref:Palmitoyltransferase n=1 Tax=Phascolomyces articulosus TaxID=60185 RepID=A0AAD5PK07_9FUNG|nr:DHHC palmitoyltransferase-domain-containing protein [Phascolomyces articulosus]